MEDPVPMAVVSEGLDVLWADAELESLSLDYELVTLNLRETTGVPVVVEAHGPISLALDGLWDEVIIESGALVENDEFAARGWNAIQARLGSALSDSGYPDRNRRTFQTLLVTMIDGCQLRVAAARSSRRESASRAT